MQVALADDKVVANALKRNEVEGQNARDCFGGHAAVCLPGVHAAGGGQVAVRDAIVSPHAAAADSQLVEMLVQQEPAASPDVAIDNTNARTGSVGNAANLPGIPMGYDEALLPQSKGENGYVLPAKEAKDGGKVRFACLLVADVAASDVNYSLAKQLQRAKAIAVFNDEINPLPPQMTRKNGDSRIAAGDEQAPFKGARMLEKIYHCLGGPLCSFGRCGHDAVCKGQAPRTQFRCDGDESVVYTA